MTVQWKINCKELEINTDITKDFDINVGCGWLWTGSFEKPNILSFTKFKNCNLLNIELLVNINILKLYDNNGNKINNNEWNKYINENNNQIEERKSNFETEQIGGKKQSNISNCIVEKQRYIQDNSSNTNGNDKHDYDLRFRRHRTNKFNQRKRK
eukprot:821381_1